MTKKQNSALTPMMIQYLVGLCCLKHDPNAINITLGDMVYDEGAEEKRDVDITVTIEDKSGNFEIFKAAEVKDEQKSLDVATVEQLSKKLEDMPKVTHKSIFSTSGYSKGAISKAKANSVDLYTLMPWDKPIEENFPDFKGFDTPANFFQSFESSLLYWIGPNTYVVVPKASGNFNWQNDTPIFANSGKKHTSFPSMAELIEAAFMRSTEVLCKQEPMFTSQIEFQHGMVPSDTHKFVGPQWPCEYVVDVSSDEAYLKLKNELLKIDKIEIRGKLQWGRKKVIPEFFILKNVFDQTPFAGAAVATHGTNDGRMCALVFPKKGRSIGVHNICIPEKQRNMIRNLRIK